jgi:glutamate-1-semialdehyde 2,1-aminomutase
LLAFARRYLPAGVRSPTASPDSALAIKQGKGARVFDLSGNEYIDYLLGSGAAFLGHAHPDVSAAISQQLERGTAYLMVSEPAVYLAEEIVKAVPCADKVSFHTSGSEATFFALRLARAWTGRDKVLKFEGGYHGMSDYALMSNQWTYALSDYPAAVPNSSGIPRVLDEEVLVAPFNDLATTADIIERHREQLAAVIVEPLQRTIPPASGFLEGLREITRANDILLVFDEIVTGFRLAYGGAQEYYGVTPDLCAVGKAISAGLPFSALCGRDDIMSLVDPARHGSGTYARVTGTFSGNPVVCSAALASLRELKAEGTYERLHAAGRRLVKGLQESLERVGIPAQVAGEPPVFEVWFTREQIRDFRSTLVADAGLGAEFAQLLLERGVLKAHEKFFVSVAHSDEDVDLTIDVFAQAAEELARRHPGART